MSRHPRLREEPIGFAHRGASAHAPENTLEAFRLARRLGAEGLESDVWLTADGVPVLDHDGVVGGRRRRARRAGPTGPVRGGGRRRPISAVEVTELPDHIPTLEELYAEVGAEPELSLDVKDPAAADAVMAVARAAGAVDRLWLCHPDWEQVARWRELDDDVRLVDSTRVDRMREGPERRAASLARAGVDAVNLHHTDWSGGLTTLFHRFERHCLGWDAQQPRVLDTLLDMGCDGVYSDHVDRMTDALAREAGASPGRGSDRPARGRIDGP